MHKTPLKAQLPLRLFAIVMSAGFFTYLIYRAGAGNLSKSLSELGWGIVLVLALAGVSHLVRTWGWRLTLGDDQHKISFSRMVGLRLGAEAAGQLGILGQTLGDSVRVSRMSAEIPIATGLASVTLDRGLYIVTATVTTIAGILAALVSSGVRSRFRRFINENFFSLKYDYRVEWEKAIRELTANPGQDTPERVLRILCDLMDTSGGAIWLYRESWRQFTPAAKRGDTAVVSPVPEDDPRIEALRSGDESFTSFEDDERGALFSPWRKTDAHFTSGDRSTLRGMCLR